jgi:hypothetical protein
MGQWAGEEERPGQEEAGCASRRCTWTSAVTEGWYPTLTKSACQGRMDCSLDTSLLGSLRKLSTPPRRMVY